MGAKSNFHRGHFCSKLYVFMVIKVYTRPLVRQQLELSAVSLGKCAGARQGDGEAAFRSLTR